MRTLSRLSLALLLALLSLIGYSLVAAQGPVEPQHHDPAWRGEYFNNMYLSGFPTITRDDASIAFDWGSGSPHPAIGSDNFSVRWTRMLDLSAGSYRFWVTVDDGVRLWVDGHLLINQWHDQAATTYSADIYLNSGHHLVQMEYYEHAGVASAKLWWEGGGTYPDWKGEYFNNRDLSGSPTFTRNDVAIHFDWGTGSPGAGLAADNFSVRWTRTLYFSAGNYRFTTTTDDGVRLWVDSHIIIDKWYDQPPTSHSGDIYLAAGNHTVVMEYYEHSGGAVARLSWGPPEPAGPWRGDYFNNPWLSGAPLFTRYHDRLEFNWGWGGPGGGLPNDNFSVRWSRSAHFSATGRYTFYARTDDGVRLWVDGHLVIDYWHDQSATTRSGSIYLYQGTHQVVVEYYEHGGLAEAKVWWEFSDGGDGGTVVVDELSPGFYFGGPLSGRREAYIGYGGHMYWTYNSTYNYYNYAKWTPSLPRAGYYDVYAYIPRCYATTHSARYRIFHNGLRHDRVINQYIYADQWVHLGCYYFSATGREFVFLADNTHEPRLTRHIGLDAIKFVSR